MRASIASAATLFMLFSSVAAAGICPLDCPPGYNLLPPCRCVPTPTADRRGLDERCPRICDIGEVLTHGCECVPAAALPTITPAVEVFGSIPAKPLEGRCPRVCDIGETMTTGCQCVPEYGRTAAAVERRCPRVCEPGETTDSQCNCVPEH